MKKNFVFISLLTLGSFAFTGKEFPSRYTFKKDHIYELLQTSTMTQYIAVAGTEQTVSYTIKGGMKLKTIEATGTSGKFEIEYTSLSMKIKMPQMEMDSEGDTTKPANKITNKLISAMLRKKFNFTLAKDGSVASVENIENLWSGLNNQDPVMMQMKGQLEQSFGKEPFRRSLEEIFVFYPDTKIQTGSTWKKISSTGSTLPLQISSEYTLQSITEPSALIISDGQISTTDTTKVINAQGGFKATASLKGRQVVRSTVSATSGWPESGKLYSEVKGKMILLAGGQIPEDMPMHMEMKTESEFTLVKK
ncbi:MAG: hypothetical protein JSS93_05235 [Bacteroidetes bacterium]|nr:hypothetical protein [Bacteroidota bacterium]